MSVADPELVRGFRQLVPPPRQTAHDARVLTLEFGFDGGGQALTAGWTQPLRLSFPCKIVGAYLYGNVASSATISLAFGTSADWPRNAPISPSSPFSLGGAAYVALSVANWTIWLQPADVLVAKLLTVTGGIAVALLAVDVIRLPSANRSVGTMGLLDLAGDRVVNSAGNPVVARR